MRCGGRIGGKRSRISEARDLWGDYKLPFGASKCIWHLRDSDTLSLTDFASNRDDQSLFSGAVHATHLLVCVVPAGGFNRAKTNPLYAAALVLLVRQYLGALDKRCQISGYAAFRDT